MLSKNFEENNQKITDTLGIGKNFDVLYKPISIDGVQGGLYFIDGFVEEAILEKLLEYFHNLKKEDLPESSESLIETIVPYVEVSLIKTQKEAIQNILSGVTAFFIDGYDVCIGLDCRSYPARSVEEPSKDKTLRGSRDGFVETIVFNTALIRRRIRSSNLAMEIYTVGESSKTDVVFCYMKNRVDATFLKKMQEKIKNIRRDALTMNQESLAESIYAGRWYNPFPKFKYTERPDTAAASILEGNLIILVDNAPQVMIVPTSLFDIMDEADDYYFPPITGSYLKLSRFLIGIVTLFLTPVFLLLIENPQWIPRELEFIIITDTIHVPIVWQFLILELAIDGLKLAAINTPNMLTTPLSVVAGIVLGQFSVDSGWFNSEVMLYMAFVAIANYTQSNFELGYALKFMRILLLLTTSVFGIWGFGIGTIAICMIMATNKSVSGNMYLYPLIPFQYKELRKRLFRS
ncbi:MAG: spore germination protein [Eubacteriales bacterium]